MGICRDASLRPKPTQQCRGASWGFTERHHHCHRILNQANPKPSESSDVSNRHGACTTDAFSPTLPVLQQCPGVSQAILARHTLALRHIAPAPCRTAPTSTPAVPASPNPAWLLLAALPASLVHGTMLASALSNRMCGICGGHLV